MDGNGEDRKDSQPSEGKINIDLKNVPQGKMLSNQELCQKFAEYHKRHQEEICDREKEQLELKAAGESKRKEDEVQFALPEEDEASTPVFALNEEVTAVDFSFFMFSPKNRVRKVCNSIATNVWFDRFILLTIMANCVCLALVDPTGNEKQDELGRADYFFTAVFTLELLLRVVARGAVISPQNKRVRYKFGRAYFSDPWNWIDFIVVATAWPPLFLDSASLSAFRAFRVLRPLRTLNVVPNMRLVVSSLFSSIPLLLDVTFQAFFLLSVFSILGTMVFGGKLHQHCTNGSELFTSEEFEDGILCGSVKCVAVEPSIVPPLTCQFETNDGQIFEAPERGFVNFDNFLWSMLTVFTCATLEGWTDVMYMIMDVTHPISALFFVALIFLVSFLVFDLALAVIADTFYKLKEGEYTNKGPEDFQHRLQRHSVANRSLKDSFTVAFRQTYAEIATRLDWFSPTQQFFRSFVTSPLFELFINCIVVINIVALALIYYEMPTTLKVLLETFNLVFVIIFVLEMVLKVIGLGPICYFSDAMNCLDSSITVLSVVEIALSTGSISTFRILRLLRLIKLFRSLHNLQLLLLKVLASFVSVVTFFPVMALFLFIFTILAMQIYGQSYTTTIATAEFPKVGSICTFAAKSDTGCPRSNFSTFWNAFLVIFQILTGENWNAAMYDAMAYTSAWSSLFFVAIFIISNFVLLNIFLTIMLLKFAEPDDEFEAAAARATGDKLTILESLQNAKKGLIRLVTCKKSKQPAVTTNVVLDITDDATDSFYSARASFGPPVQPIDTAVDEEKEDWFNFGKSSLWNSTRSGMGFMGNQNSLWLFSPENRIRKFCKRVSEHRIFEFVVLSTIVVNSISLALYSPLWPPDSVLLEVLNILNVLCLGIFTVEAALKIIAMGCVLHPGAYLRDSWNVLDFLIVVTGLLELLPLGTGSGFLTSFRALRALRPLRMVKRLNGLRVVFFSIAKAIPSCGNALVVAVLVWFVFAVIGVNFFAGKFYACQCDFVPYGTDTPLVGSPEPSELRSVNRTVQHSIVAATGVRQTFGSTCDPEFIAFLQTQNNARIPCEEAGGTWVTFPSNFDNTLIALLTLFEVATLENWLDVMHAAMDAVGVDREPVEDVSELASLYFIFFILIGSFFTLNLFVSVIVDAFSHIKRQAEYGTNALLTRAQFEWLEDQRMVLRMNALKQPVPPRPGTCMSGLRQFAFRFTASTIFDWIITGVILLNTVCLALEFWNMSSFWEQFSFLTGLVFTLIFVGEMVIKLIGLGPRQYFSDFWNLFDFVIVILSLIPLIFDIMALAGESVTFNTNFIRAMRVLRLLRILRLVKRLKNVRVLFQTLFLSLPSLGNVGAVLFLVFYIYSIVGIQLFGRIGILPYPPPNGGGIEKYSNFWHFGTALLTLLRCSTGGSWNAIMWDIIVQGGGFSWAWIYFVSFIVIGSFIVLNLFIAIVLEAFATIMEHENFHINEVHLEEFAKVWARFDPNGDKYIEVVRDIKPLLRELRPPLGLGPGASTAEVIKFVESLRLPDGTHMKMARDGRVGFHELLASLICRTYRVDMENLPDGLRKKLKKENEYMENRRKKAKGNTTEEELTVTAENARTHFASTTLQIIARRYMERTGGIAVDVPIEHIHQNGHATVLQNGHAAVLQNGHAAVLQNGRAAVLQNGDLDSPLQPPSFPSSDHSPHDPTPPGPAGPVSTTGVGPTGRLPPSPPSTSAAFVVRDESEEVDP